MPNWCYQHAEVRGSNAQLRRFIDAIRVEKTPEWEAQPSYDRESWDLNQLFPIPKDLEETISGGYAPNDDGTKSEKQIDLEEQRAKNIAKYGHKDWYDWALANWDTKWGACRVQFDEDTFDDTSTSIHLYWESAWGPAVGLIKKISEQFDELLFGFHMTEEANFFAGYIVIHAGEVETEFEHDMDGQPEYDENDEKWEDKYSDWTDRIIFELAEGLKKEMDSYQLANEELFK